MTIAPELKLRNGGTIPHVGLGTWPMDNAEAATTVGRAIDMGYRLIDTASAYGNERGVGEGVRNSNVPRSEVHVTTKLPGSGHGYDATRQAFDTSIETLGLDYVDLYLIHWPLPHKNLYVDSWRAMIELQKEGRVRAIGVSNFRPHHLNRLIEETGVVPDVNQVQLHPAIAQQELRRQHEQLGIVTQSWSPLGMGANATVFKAAQSKLDDPVISEVATKHNRPASQIVLRWHVQLGLVAIPKSSSPERLQQNLDLFDFTLTAEDMAKISELDEGEAAAVDPDSHDE